ncbi:hypothetical protein Pla52o_51620 [Novipirellula galeiformis]|uniref:Uncharacterized protein n=1 Tax=Novipirellula galeiformis TaxID=2528004 RepID=A0A5C6BZR3_9BACT|nr:hypothetical protein Pla52o_51620 [Novipirellula galeiformis]
MNAVETTQRSSDAPANSSDPQASLAPLSTG